MKLYFLPILVIGVLLISGCTTTPQFDNKTTKPTQETAFSSPTQSPKEPFEALEDMEKEINRISSENKLIGDEHYKQLKGKLDYFESQGADKTKISELRKKLDALLAKPGTSQIMGNESQNKLSVLESEINGILQSGNRVGPDHYNRMLSDLNSLESQGFDKSKIAK